MSRGKKYNCEGSLAGWFSPAEEGLIRDRAVGPL